MLHGRCAEQAMVQELLHAARDGVSGALIVRGEPGIGKTALLDHAAERADGMRVLRGAGIESETELPFAGLHLLFHTALDRLDALPGPQQRALAGAFASAGIPEIHLTGLDADSASAVLDDGGVPLPPALRDQLIADTRGNP